jgi:hypothetical protein
MDPELANNPHVMRMMQDVAANAANVGRQAEFVPSSPHFPHLTCVVGRLI